MQPAAPLSTAGGRDLTLSTADAYPRVVPDIAVAQPDRRRTPLPSFALIFAVWLIPALLSGFDTYMQGRLDGQRTEWRWVLFNSLDWLLYAALTPIVFRASRRFPLQRARIARGVIVHVAGALIMCVAWAGLGTLLRLLVFHPPPGFTAAQLLRQFESWVFTTLPFGTGVYFALVGIEHALFFMDRARERETQAAHLAAQLSEARLSALRMQLNPHFLFNSLNAIAVLVRDRDIAAASRMLELLSDVLRQVLRSEPAHETTLANELEFVRRYLEIERIRFSDRLRPNVEADPALANALVPSFILQPLVENALRHGIARRSSAGLLQVSAGRDGPDLVLEVRDDGPGLSQLAPSRDAPPTPGVGLSNTRARLAALYGDRAALQVTGVEGGGVTAIVRLPYHEAQSDAGGPQQNPHTGSR